MRSQTLVYACLFSALIVLPLASSGMAQEADLSILVQDGTTSAVPGESLTYTLTVRNLAGPDDVAGAIVQDNFPSSLSCLWTCQGVGGASCTPGQAAGNINDTVVLPAGGTLTYTAVCDIDADATGTLANTATVSTPPGVSDPNPSNDTSSDLDTELTPEADLTLSKTDSVTAAVPGQDTLTYEIVARNPNGPSDVVGASLSDVFPADLTCLWTCVASGGATCTPGQVAGDISDTLNLPVGGRAAYTALCEIDPLATGTLQNTASLQTPPGVSDVNSGNNVAADLDTELTPRTDVAISKTDGVDEATPGETVTYTVTVSHQGGPSGVSGAIVRDDFPAPLTCAWTCDGQGGAQCNPGPVDGDLADAVTLPVGSTATYTAQCSIDPLATGILDNTATVSVPDGVVDLNGGNNIARDDDTQLIPQVDLAITVDNGVDEVVPGETVVYEIIASNPQLLFAFGAAQENTPHATLFRLDPRTAEAQDLGSLDLPGLGLNACERLILDVDGSLWAACSDALGALHWLTLDSRDGSLRRRGGAPVGLFPLDSPSHEIPWGQDRRLTLVDDGDTTFLGVVDDGRRQVQVIGDSGVHLSVLSRRALPPTDDPATAVTSDNVSGARVENVFAESLDCTWTCVASGGATCDSGPVAGSIDDEVDLPLGGSVIYTAVCDVDAGALGDLSNTATITPPDDVEEIDANDNSFTDLDTLTPQSDLSLSKSDGVSQAIPGQSVTYSITARNIDGPSDALGATVEDLFSADLSCIWSCIPSGGASCTQGQVAGNIQDTVDLPVGGEVTFTAQCAIASSALGTLSNTATVSPVGDDPNTGNNSASDLDTTLIPMADLTISKSDGVTQAIPGEGVTYVITAANPVGPSAIQGAVVHDTFPDSLECLWTCASSGGALCTPGPGSGDITDTVQLPVGSTVTYTAQCTIASDASGTLSNTASVTLPDGSVDSNAANNSASDLDTTLIRRADIRLTKDDGQEEAVVGDSTLYVITVINDGPSDAADVRVLDIPPSELTCLWTCEAEDGASCKPGPVDGDLDDTANLPAGLSVVYEGDCAISAAASGELVNRATATVPTGIEDPDLGNNEDSDTNTLIFEADLTLTKTDGVTQAIAGDSVTYSIVMGNDGPSPVSGAQVVDTFSSVLDCSWTCSPTGGGVCTPGPVSGDIDETVDLPAAATVTFTAHCAIDPAATGTLSNTATASMPEGVFELDPSNNTATDDDTEILVVADLFIEKTDGVTQATPGLDLTYTLTVGNESGPSDMVGARVTDLFADVLDCSWTCEGTLGGRCAAGTTPGDVLDTVDLPVGSTVTYRADCAIDASAEGFLTNTATVAAADGTSDPDTSNNSATDDDTELIPMADLDVLKDDGVSTVVAGTAVVYSIQVRNPDGPSDVRDVLVEDDFPATLDCQWSCVAAAGASCGSGTQIGDIDDLVDLPIGGNITYTAACTVDSSATGVLVNTVSATVPEGGTFTDSDSTTVLLEADVSVTKTDGTDTATPGSSTTYAIVVTNDGPSDVRDATVIDVPPPGVTCTWTCEPTGGAICDPQPTGNLVDIIDLPAGGTAAYTAQCAIPSRAFGYLINRVSVDVPDDVTELDADNNSAKDTDLLVPRHDLVLDKTTAATSVGPGDRLTYVLEVTNQGPSDAQGVIVRDTLPQDVVIIDAEVVGATLGALVFADGFESGSTVNWGHGLGLGQCGPVEAAEGPSVRCMLGSVAPGAHPSVVLQVEVSDDAEGALINTGIATSFTAETVLGNNTDSVVTPLEVPLVSDVASDGVHSPEGLAFLKDDPGGNTSQNATSAATLAAGISASLSVRGDFSEGGRVVYELFLHNDGPQSLTDAAAAEWIHPLPQGLEWISASSDVGTTTLVANASAIDTPETEAVVWNGHLAAGDSAHIVVEARTLLGTAGLTIDSQGTVYTHIGVEIPSDDPSLPGGADATSFTVEGVSEIPTLGDLGVLALITSLLGAGILRLRRRNARQGPRCEG